jgi:hypothetical protein
MPKSPAASPEQGDDLLAKIAWAAEASTPGGSPDPEAAAGEARQHRRSAAELAAALGLDWPMPPDLLEAAYWAGKARHILRRRDQAIRAAAGNGRSQRAIGSATGLSHSAISRVSARSDSPGTRW